MKLVRIFITLFILLSLKNLAVAHNSRTDDDNDTVPSISEYTTTINFPTTDLPVVVEDEIANLGTHFESVTFSDTSHSATLDVAQAEESIAHDRENPPTIQEITTLPGFTVYAWNVGQGSGIASASVRDQIVAMNPDILFLCETGTEVQTNELITYLNTQLNTNYQLYYQEMGSSTFPLAFLSKYPYSSTQTIVHPNIAKALLRVVVNIAGDDYILYGLHANTAKNINFHENEAQQFLTEIGATLRTIIVGDFNSRSRLDGAVHSLNDLTYSTQGWAYPNTVSTDLFTAEGFTDTWRYQHPYAAVAATKLTKRGTVNSGSNLGERIDYIWVSPDLTTHILDAGINTETTNYLSDHRSVWVRIDAGVVTMGGEHLDKTPTIASSVLASNNRYLDITFTEGVYSDINASQPLTVDNFELAFDPHANGNANGCTISSIRKPDSDNETTASPLIGGETTVRLFLNIDGITNGNETIKVHLAGKNPFAQDDSDKVPAHIYNSAGIADHWAYVDYTQTGIASVIRTNYHRLNATTLTVTFIAEDGGTVNGKTQIQQYVSYGSPTSQITALPEAGFDFVNWTKAGVEYSTNPTLVIDPVTENMVVTAHFAKEPNPNILLNGQFTEPLNLAWSVNNSHADLGWYVAKKGRWAWDATNQWVYVAQANGSARIVQVLSAQDLQGILNLAFKLFNTEADATANTLQIQIFGVNGQFKLSTWSASKPQPLNQDPSFSYTTWFDQKITEESLDWTEFNTPFKVTSEYEYLVLSFVVKGVNPPAGDLFALDKVSLATQAQPIAYEDSYLVSTDQLIVDALSGILANDVDPQGSHLTAKLLETVKQGQLTLNPDGSFEYIPNANFTIEDSFTYQAKNTQNVYSSAVTVSLLAPNNIIVNGNFTELLNINKSSGNTGSAHADLGWYVAANSRWAWDDLNQWVYTRVSGSRALTQVCSGKDLSGTLNLDFKLMNTEADTKFNRLHVQLFGINGQFTLSQWKKIPPQSNNDPTFAYTTLLDDTLDNGQSFNWTALSTPFEITSDYDYLAIRFFVKNVDPNVGDLLALDDVRISQ